MVKQHYKVLVMYQRKASVRYVYAYSPKQARILVLKRLAEEQQIEPLVVFGYFKNRPDAVSVQIETQFKEVEK